MKLLPIYSSTDKTKASIVAHAKVDDDIFDLYKEGSWVLDTTGYPKLKTVDLHVFVFGFKDGFEIDHIDRDRLNAQRSNLRFLTKDDNQRNRAGWSKSGLKGAYLKKNHNVPLPWISTVIFNKKNKYLGSFATKEEAHAAYRDFSEKNFKNVACLKHKND